jgi:transposase
MIALQSDVRVYLACGYTDMRKGMQGLAMLVQQVLAEDPFNGALYAFRGRRPTSDIQHTVFAPPESRIPGIRYSGRRCRCRLTAAGRICNVSTRTNGLTLAASFRPGCSMRATAQA